MIVKPTSASDSAREAIEQLVVQLELFAVRVRRVMLTQVAQDVQINSQSQAHESSMQPTLHKHLDIPSAPRM